MDDYYIDGCWVPNRAAFVSDKGWINSLWRYVPPSEKTLPMADIIFSNIAESVKAAKLTAFFESIQDA